MSACSYLSYSLRCMWCVHFPLPGRCSRASSSPGTVSPRSPPRHTILLHCCHSNAQLRHKTQDSHHSLPHTRCFDITANTFLETNGVKINSCGVRWAKRGGVLSHTLTLFVWTTVKYLQWCQTQPRFWEITLCVGFVCICVCGGSWIYKLAWWSCDISHLSAFQDSTGKCWHPGFRFTRWDHSPTGLQVHSPLPFPRHTHSSM